MSIDLFIEMSPSITWTSLRQELLRQGAEINAIGSDGPTGFFSSCAMPFWYRRFLPARKLRFFWEHIPKASHPGGELEQSIISMEVGSELNLSPRYSTWDEAIVVLRRVLCSIHEGQYGDFVCSDEHEKIIASSQRGSLFLAKT